MKLSLLHPSTVDLHYAASLIFAANDDATIPTFARLLPDPRHPPFCKNSGSIRHKVSMFKQVTTN
jgi:hypothetical protein